MDLLRAALQLRTASTVWVFHDIVNADWFERCVDAISEARDVLPLAELVSDHRYTNACSITFDDGLRSVMDIAHPVLEARELPYTVFVCTDVLTGGHVLWFLRVFHLAQRLGLGPLKRRWTSIGERARTIDEFTIALKEVPLNSILRGLDELEAQHEVLPPDPRRFFLSADDVRTLSARGATIGSHTHRHPILSRLTLQEQTSEVEESVKVIKTITERSPTEFAYPNGTYLDFDPNTIAVLRAHDFRVAVTTEQRHISHADDVMALPRVGLSDGESVVRRFVKTIVPSISRTSARERSLRSHSR